MKVYLDNGATSYPKPQSVYNDMFNYMTKIGSNVGRGASSSSLMGNKIIYEARKTLIEFFNFDKIENVIFTPNITYSLNMLIKGSVKKGWHVITSVMDHNSTLRALHTLSENNIIELDIVGASKEGFINIEELKNKIKNNTKLIVLSHASNIVGSIQPLEEIGKLCREKNIYFIVDSAQSAGALEVDFKKLNCSALAFTGHKSLLGPQGIGGFLIDDEFNSECIPIIEGGTGSVSSSVIQPQFMPDKFESGTMNAPAIAGLLAGIKFINSEGINTIKEHEEYLTDKFLTGLLNMKDIIIYGNKSTENRTSTISLNSTKIDNSELGFTLDSEYGIITRTGLHCAPLAHEAVGSYPNGSIRFSFGYFNDLKDVNYTLDCINKVLCR
ncbi:MULTISPECIES: aminotransferase class V-fold PLP-dependent enzyme [Clostridium]|uniref:cysteine desulfurase n=1 Tax=Clostridium faecium TaxID=2762223 RepID=A0ABR8YN63_9CLOT|nr:MULTISPECIES: aminotransferase class V-fold PLP-dependent enzyme [Clostridium]MBD8045689.1 aminotransferase class V-fold PLP-dependent enzyme [Clostridium faecium]MDU1350513.1 aminotransferase class V-fold PLP-dependent enzyme [Clostridium argentinense]